MSLTTMTDDRPHSGAVLVAALLAPRIGSELLTLREETSRRDGRWVRRNCAYAYAAGWAGFSRWEVEDDFDTADRWPTHGRATQAAMRASDMVGEAFSAGARARAIAAITWRLADLEEAPDDLGDLIQNAIEESDIGAEAAVEVVLEALCAAGLQSSPRARELALGQAYAAEAVGWWRPSLRPEIAAADFPEPEPDILEAQPPLSPAAVPDWAPIRLGPRLRSVEFNPDIETPPPAWLVKGLLPSSGLAMLYGESSAGKTFLAIRLALCVAWGLPFFYRRVKHGAVVYLAAEGGASVLARMKAAEAALRPEINTANLARRASGLPPLERQPIHVVTEAPNLSRGGEPEKFVQTVRDIGLMVGAKGLKVAMVIGDTWHAMMAGAEENSSSDTGEALKPLRDLSEAEGFMALLLHHPGKDLERGSRGSNALPAAMDAIIELSVPDHQGPRPKPSTAIRRATVTKLRDGEAGGTLAYRLSVVETGRDEDGDPLTTCTVLPVTEEPRDDAGLSAVDRELMVAFEKAQVEGRARVDAVRSAFYAGRPGRKPDALKKAFQRAKVSIERAGSLVTDTSDQWFSRP